MRKKLSTALLAAIALSLLAACSLTASPPTPESQTLANAGNAAYSTLLPHSLYFLSDAQTGIFQVWYLAPDGGTPRQITSEPTDVVEFDVSPIDGKVAYITNNQLHLINSDGSQRTRLVDGGQVDDQNRVYHYTQKLSGVSWSPSGSLLAYGQNGIHLYSLKDQSDTQIVENVLETMDGGQLFPIALYTPVSWSPDGDYLLITIGFFEGSGLGTFNIQNTELVALGGDQVVCCHPQWAPDSRSILVASPILGSIASGLWRFDAETGAEVELIHHTSEDNTLNFAGWPLQLPNGELRYFFNNMAAFPENQASLLMVSAGSDGISGREPIRSEYWENYEALWSEDGSLVVAVQPATGVEPSWPRTGPIVVIPASSQPVVPLSANGYSLRWGP